METIKNKAILVQTIVNKPINQVWKTWTTPADIVKWNNASEDWHTPHAENDLRVGGKFLFRMEAKDGSVGFDLGGIYTDIKLNKQIIYILDDGRRVKISFSDLGKKTEIVETFEAEHTNSIELQRNGWQAILNNFKNYTEK
jgi:uncharacterized protein YndB with AHSA1/START domain